MPLKHWLAWSIDHLFRKPVPVFDHPLSKEMLLNTQFKPPLMQLWAIPKHPITGYQGEELSTSISTSPPQKAVESNEVGPQSPSLQTRQDQSPQLLLTGHSFQLCHQLYCSPLEALKDLHILLQLWDPELHTVLEVRLHQRWIQWDNHFFCPAGYAVFDAPRMGFALLAARTDCWLLLSPLLTSTPWLLSAGLFSSHSSPNSYLYPPLLHPRCRIQHLDLLNFIPLIAAKCSNLSRSLCKTFHPSGESTEPPSLVSWVNLLMVRSTPAWGSCINMLHRTGPRAAPLETHHQMQPQKGAVRSGIRTHASRGDCDLNAAP